MIKKWVVRLGPGIITAALVFGPSKMTITSKLGAEHGYSLLWIIVVAIFFLAVFMEMSSRIGIATNQSLLTTIKQKWGKKAALAIGFGAYMVSTSFQAGNSIGVGISLAEISKTSPQPWIIVFTLAAISLLFFKSFYKVLEKIMIALIVLMLFSFIVTLVLTKPPISEIATGLNPSIPQGSFGLVTAFMASCFSISAAFYQSYLVQERKCITPDVKLGTKDSFTGIITLGLMSSIVMICAATVLHPGGIKINNASDMGRALEPLFGKFASYIFLLGLFGASFSSLIGNASVGGTLFADALGYDNRFNSKPVRFLTGIVMIVGATIAIVFGKLPLELIVFAQSITIFIVPVIGIAMFTIANDEKIMKSMKNKPLEKIIGVTGLLILILLGLQSIRGFLG